MRLPKLPLARAKRQSLPVLRAMATRTRLTLPTPLAPQPRSRERPVSVTPRRRLARLTCLANVEFGAIRSRQPLPEPVVVATCAAALPALAAVKQAPRSLWRDT